ncbi:dihydroxy-acid dehydratase, partial [Bosea sp. TND4EK4]|uniref:dihydroxy-acid dehydratase n=1 Tax=Bosea sp. TND4EK4 TaxID=1907408 RepID=UPI000955B816
GLHLRSFVTTTKPKSSLNHNLKSVPLVLTADSLDVPDRSIEMLVDEAELTRRAAELPAVERPEWAQRGYARLYHDSVTQADEGCDFDFMMPVRR